MLYAALAGALGPRAAVIRDYKTCNGRWAANGFEYVLAGAPGLETTYPWLLLAIASTIVVSVYRLMSSAFSESLSTGTRWWFAVGFFVLYWTGSPSVSEGFYWLSGSIFYQLSVSLGVALLAAMIRSARSECADHPGRVACLTVLAVVTTGFHELFGTVLWVVLCTGTILAFRLRVPARWTWGTTAAGCLVGVAFVVLAPGNGVRLHGLNVRHDWAAFRLSVRYIGHYWLAWLLDPKLLLATLLVVISPPYASANPPWVRRGLTERWWLVFPTLLLLLAGLMVTVAWYAQGGTLPPRALSGAYIYFLLGWLATAFFISRIERDALTVPFAPRVAVLLLCCLSLLAVGNFRPAASDLYRTAAPYHQAMRRRYELIREAVARGEQVVRVTPLPVIPRTLGFLTELVPVGDDTNPQAFVNMENAFYFRVRSIALEPPPTR